MKDINKKNVIWNIIGATTSAFNSLLFTIIVTRINGVNDAGIFTYSFATACLLYFIGNYSGRAFQVTDLSKENTDTCYIYNRIITCIIMMTVSIIFATIKRYDIYKSTIFILLCIFKTLEAFSEVLYGIIQKNGELYKVGISLFIKALLGVATFFIVNYITRNLIIACTSIVIINIIFIIFYDIKNLKKHNISKSKFTIESNNRILKLGFFTFVLSFLSTYLLNASRYAIDNLSTNDMQTIFGIIIMPATFMGIIGQYIIQPALTKLANNIKNKDYIKLKRMIVSLLMMVLIIGILVFVIAYLLEVPVLELVYGIELKIYFISMMTIIIGSISYAINTVISTVLIAMRRTFGQAIIYGIVSIIATILSHYMVKKYQILGASITYMITMFIVTMLFLSLLFIGLKKYKKEWKEE